MSLVIYHNPRCSKSRQTLELLKENGHDPEIIEYLKTPLNKGQIFGILSKLERPAKDIIRVKEEEFKGRNVDLEDKESIADAIVAVPKLMERPIVVNDDKAAIGRPPESVLEILK